MNDFIGLLKSNDEFEFEYNGVSYEIISELGRTIYTKDNKLVDRFIDNDDLLNNAFIQNKPIKDILDKIICK